ncbi:unnamed protein product [Eretmochelys imbricata]
MGTIYPRLPAYSTLPAAPGLLFSLKPETRNSMEIVKLVTLEQFFWILLTGFKEWVYRHQVIYLEQAAYFMENVLEAELDCEPREELEKPEFTVSGPNRGWMWATRLPPGRVSMGHGLYL